MKILITGAAGFIGSHLLIYFLNQNYEVLGVDNYSIGKYKHPNIIKLELNDKIETENIIKKYKPDLLYHLAAWAHEGLSQFCPVRITENNYNAYLNTLVPFIKNSGKKVVLTSSMSVYGDQNSPFYEEADRKPIDIYGIAKSSMEIATEVLSKVHNFEYVILRPHNVYGIRQNMSDPYRNVVAIFINKLLKNESFYIYGDGEQRRSFTYIDDITPYIAKSGLDEDITKQIINIGPIKDYSINELSQEISKHFKNPPKPIYLSDRPQEVRLAWCSNKKAIKLLNYRTSVNFGEGIEKMVNWAKKEGPKKMKYLVNLELESGSLPISWKEKLI